MSEQEWKRLPEGGGTGGAGSNGRLLPPAGQGTGLASPRSVEHAGGEPADLARYWQIVRTRWRLIAATCFLVLAAVALGTWLQTPVFRAAGMMEIRRQGSEVVPVDALFQADRISSQYLQTQYEILRSPALARRVVTELGMVQERLEEPGAGGSPEDSTTLLESVVIGFRERLFIEPVQGSYLVRVRFEASDPRRAARAVNSVFENYIRMRIEAAGAAVRRLDGQVANARQDLATAESRLNDYVRSNELLVVANVAGERENVPYERLRQLQQELTSAEGTRYEKEARYRLLSSQGVDALSSEVLRSLSVRVAELRGEYANLRSTFTDDYPRTRQVKQQLEELEEQLAGERRRVAAEIRDEYLAARERQLLLRQALDEQHAQIEALSEKAADYYVLQRDVEGQRQLFSTLQQRQKEAEVAAALAATEVDVVEWATPPQRPVRPAPKRNLQLGLVVGLMLGLGLAVFRELTGSVAPILDEADAQSVPVLGMIPSVRSLPDRTAVRAGAASGKLLLPTRKPTERHRIDQIADPNSVLAEAFGALRTSVLFDAPSPSPRTLLITSTQPGEGKTTVSSNLAISLTRLRRRVLLIDADLRRPALHRTFGIEPAPGLADALTREPDWLALVRPNVVPGLDLLTAGSPSDSPSELLSSGRMRRLVAQARAAYDFVIIDSPALLIHAPDARLLAPLADGSIVVVRSRGTSREQVRLTLRQVANLVGVVLNDVDFERHFPAHYQGYYATGAGDAVRTADV